MFKKFKKKESQPLNVSKENYSVAMIDYLRNNEATKLGVQAVTLSLFEKNYLIIEKTVVNLSTPWAPNEQEIVRISLSPTINPDKVIGLEDHMINWIMFTFGDGVYTNLTQVQMDLTKKEFIDANCEMFEGYKRKVYHLADQLDLVDSPFSDKQRQYYKEVEISDLNSKKLVYNQSYQVDPMIQMLLDLFDQTL